MKKLNENQLQSLEAGKFWGWSCGPSYYVSGQCLENCVHHIFWVQDTQDLAVACGTH